MINIIVPIKDNEKYILPFFISLKKAIDYANVKKWMLYFSLNGCKDNSMEIVKKLKRRYNNIKILYQSEPSKIRAQDLAVRSIKNNGLLIFIDCDVIIDKESIYNIQYIFKQHRNILVVGGLPLPFKVNLKELSLIRILKYYILNFSSIFYHSKIPKYTLNSNSSNLRNYFHGRIFALRSKRYWLIKDFDFPDDIQLIDLIYEKFGLNTFIFSDKIRCYYEPYLSFKKDFLSHLRAYFFLKDFYLRYPHLKRFKRYFILKYNLKYIKTLPHRYKVAFLFSCLWTLLRDKIYFLIYLAMRKKKNGNDLWR